VRGKVEAALDRSIADGLVRVKFRVEVRVEVRVRVKV
tara:strand:+ start:259 stop:369 length:111 start_codon:yes stop_codon:yes gene_type:complete